VQPQKAELSLFLGSIASLDVARIGEPQINNGISSFLVDIDMA